MRARYAASRTRSRPPSRQSTVIGVLVIADRTGDVDTFDKDDLKLCETLASHLSIALENSRLGQSLPNSRSWRARLRYQAMHDPLTGLPNRWLFIDRVEQGLIRRGFEPGSIAVLFVDIDDFKTVNDSLGHMAGTTSCEEWPSVSSPHCDPRTAPLGSAETNSPILIDEPGASAAAPRPLAGSSRARRAS